MNFLDSYKKSPLPTGIIAQTQGELLLLEPPKEHNIFHEKKLFWAYFPALCIGGFFIFALICALAYAAYYDSHEILSEITSSDVVMYAEIRNSMFAKNVNDATDPFWQELYSFAGTSLQLPYSIQKDILPLIHNEGALLLVDENGIKPIFLLRTKNNALDAKKFSYTLQLKKDIVAFSNYDIPFKKYIGNFSRTVASETRESESSNAFLKIFINLNKTQYRTPGIPYMELLLQKNLKREFTISFPNSTLQHQKNTKKINTPGTLPNYQDFSLYLHNMKFHPLILQKVFQIFGASQRAQEYFKDDILFQIKENIEFGMKNNATNDFFLSFELMDNIQEDAFIEKFRYFMAYLKPEEKIKILPDETTITEEILLPEKYYFELINKKEGLYAIHLSENENLYYLGPNNKRIVISNSMDCMDDMLKGNKNNPSFMVSFLYVNADVLKDLFPILRSWNFLSRNILLDMSLRDFIKGNIL